MKEWLNKDKIDNRIDFHKKISRFFTDFKKREDIEEIRKNVKDLYFIDESELNEEQKNEKQKIEIIDFIDKIDKKELYKNIMESKNLENLINSLQICNSMFKVVEIYDNPLDRVGIKDILLNLYKYFEKLIPKFVYFLKNNESPLLQVKKYFIINISMNL
jgi:hypothetical protein